MRTHMQQSIVALVDRMLRAMGPGRIGRLVHLLRQRDATWIDGLITQVLKQERLGRFKHRAVARPPGAILVSNPDPALDAQLDQIPSETTPAERRFLYHYFAHLWSGTGSVLEIGPFLGGTTRAMAMGMLANPNRAPTARLHTFDRFQSYYDAASLVDYLKPLFDSGLLGPSVSDEVARSGSFRAAFESLHTSTAYGPLVVAYERPLPERPSLLSSGGPWFDVPPGVDVQTFFVDGCKGWFATKYFMQRCLATARPGAIFIFQDYLWRTCFWLPAFLETFPDDFRHIAQVDSTHVFQLIHSLDPATVAARFPDEPEALGLQNLEALFGAVISRSVNRADPDSAVYQNLQYAGALAYVGESDRARALLTDLLTQFTGSHYEAIIRKSQQSPTYRPNGAGGEPVTLT